ncbi:MAG: hypothetical protein JXI32_08515 [Deltaproteobacteria bacterium]|nr:hypothetical protein [Deltaproteobacteria bacterium]
MGFLKLFSGKGPEEYEKKGDRYFEIGEFGAAKLEYETALDKAEKGSGDTDIAGRLRDKITKSREGLARQHRENAERLRESGDNEGASELLALALELTQDPELSAAIEEEMDQARYTAPRGESLSLAVKIEEDTSPITEEEIDDEEYFFALCGALDDEIRRAYHGYGDTFRAGYVALNRGDYGLAVTLFSQAIEENPPDSFIPIELATAYLNLERYEEGLSLVEGFLGNHPHSVHGYHTLCEVLWADERPDDALDRLLSCPEAIADTPPIMDLKGQSMARAGKNQEAYALYQEMLQSHGRDEKTIMAQAAVCEALGRFDEALELYGEIMEQCRSCRTRVNPFVKQRYADISLEQKDYSTRTLTLYLSLIEENPAGRGYYFRKVEEIYAATGNDREARRYRQFAEALTGPRVD